MRQLSLASAAACCLLWLAGGCAGGSSPRNADRAEGQYLQGQLAQLEALEAPAKVDPASWDELKAGLRSALLERLDLAGSRAVRTVPTSELARPPLTYDRDNYALHWKLNNPGDYNQDGEVNISDLTPLAVHLGAAVSELQRDTIQGVVDGDLNGLITIADLTPIGANLGNRITGFTIYLQPNYDNYPYLGEPSTVTHLDSVAIVEYSGNRALERVSYSYDLASPLPGNAAWIRPVDSVQGAEGIPSRALAGNNNLNAVLHASLISGDAPMTVQLDASDSTGLTDLTYSFDLSGSGNFTPSLLPSAELTLTTAGQHELAVRVLDELGWFATASVLISVDLPPQWRRQALPAEDDFASVEMVSCGYTQGRLWYHGGYETTDGVQHWTRFDTASSNTGGKWFGGYSASGIDKHYQPWTDVMVADQLPAVVYSNATNAAMYFSQTEAPFPYAWNSLKSAAAPAAPDSFSVARIGLRPAIAYRDTFADALRYRWADDDDGDVWGTAVPPVPGSGHGQYASLANIDDKPAIAYYDSGLSALRYVAATDSFGTTWGAPVTIASGNIRFFDSLLELQNGRPAIVYLNTSTGNIRFRKATAIDGLDWSPFAVVTDISGPLVGLTPRASMVDRIPCVYWYEPGSGALMYASATDEEGLAWDAPEQVAGNTSATVMPCPVDMDGYPAVAYTDAAHSEFKFALRY